MKLLYNEEELFCSTAELLNFKITLPLAKLDIRYKVGIKWCEMIWKEFKFFSWYSSQYPGRNFFIAVQCHWTMQWGKKWKILITFGTCKIHFNYEKKISVFQYLHSKQFHFLKASLVHFQPIHFSTSLVIIQIYRFYKISNISFSC